MELVLFVSCEIFIQVCSLTIVFSSRLEGDGARDRYGGDAAERPLGRGTASNRQFCRLAAVVHCVAHGKQQIKGQERHNSRPDH